MQSGTHLFSTIPQLGNRSELRDWRILRPLLHNFQVDVSNHGRRNGPARVQRLTGTVEYSTEGPSTSSLRGSGTATNTHKTQIVTIPPESKPVANARTMCKPIQQSKAVSCQPVQGNVDWKIGFRRIFQFLSTFSPQCTCYSLPNPVPILIPTTRESANGSMKAIKKVQDRMPTYPYEAELLMMA